MVARTEPSGPRDHSGERSVQAGDLGRTRMGIHRRFERADTLRPARGLVGGQGPSSYRRAAEGLWRSAWRSASDYARREVLRERRPAARDRDQSAVVHQDHGVSRPAPRARERAAVAPALYAGAIRELDQWPGGGLVRQPATVLWRAVPGVVQGPRRRIDRLRCATAGAG